MTSVKRGGCMFQKGGYQEGRDEKRKGGLIHLSTLCNKSDIEVTTFKKWYLDICYKNILAMPQIMIKMIASIKLRPVLLN